MGAEEILMESKFRLIHYSYSGCPFPNPPHGLIPKDCELFNSAAYQNILSDLRDGDIIVVYNYHLSHLGGREMLDVRNNILNLSGNVELSSEQKINIYLEGLLDFAEKAKHRNVSIVLVGSAHRNNKLQFAREWFRPYDLDLLTLRDEVENARKLNNQFSSRIIDAQAVNLYFLDPLRIIGESCSKSIPLYLSCFRDTDHMNDKSSAKIVRYILKNFWLIKIKSVFV